MLSVKSAARQLARDLKTQKVRTALTLFGLVWGTAAVTLLLAFGQGLHKQIEKSMKGLGENILICWPSKTGLPWAGLPRGRRVKLDESDMEMIRRLPGVKTASGEYNYMSLKLKAGSKGIVPSVSGVAPEFGPMRSLVADRGSRWLNGPDAAGRRRVVFLGDKLAKDLFGVSDAAGRYVQIRGVPFRVVGVMQHKDQDSSYNSRDEDSAFMPGATYRALYGAKWIDNFIVQVDGPAAVEPVKKALVAALAQRHDFDPGDEEAVAIWDTTEMMKFLTAFFLIFRAFLGVVGTLTLVVGAIGVSNIMHVIVEERTREIGVKMALGARSGAILRQFMVETGMLTAAGGIVGLLFSWAICAVFPLLKLQEYIGEPRVSAPVALVTATILGLCSLLAGWFPARAASRMNPVEALRL